MTNLKTIYKIVKVASIIAGAAVQVDLVLESKYGISDWTAKKRNAIKKVKRIKRKYTKIN